MVAGKKILRGYLITVLLTIVVLFFIVGSTLFFIYVVPHEPIKRVKSRAEWIRLYKIFDKEFPEPVKEEKIVKCEICFLDLLIFDKKAKPELEKLTLNWLYVKDNKMLNDLNIKTRYEIEAALGAVEEFSLGKKNLPEELKPLFFSDNGEEYDSSILNEKLAKNMLLEIKEGYKFLRYERYTKDGIEPVLSLYFLYTNEKSLVCIQ